MNKKKKVGRLDIPAKVKKRTVKRYDWNQLKHSLPEMLVVGLAGGLFVVGAIKFLVAIISMVIGGLGIWGRVRRVKK